MDESEESESDEEANLRFYNAMAERQKLKRKKSEIQNEDRYNIQRLWFVLNKASETILYVIDCISRLEEEEEETMDENAKRAITYQVRCCG